MPNVRFFKELSATGKKVCLCGYQAAIVFVMSVIVNIPRWFEFDYEITHEAVNVTGTSLINGETTVVEVNQSRVIATPTLLRQGPIP